MSVKIGAASVRAWQTEHGIAVVEFFGVVGGREFAHLLASCVDRITPDHIGFLIRLENAVLLKLDQMEWRRYATPRVLDRAHRLPSAYVVPKVRLRAYRRYTMSRALDGAVIGAFSEVPDAQAWLIDRGMTLAAQGRHRIQVRRTSPVVLARTPSAGAVDSLSDQEALLGLLP